VDKLGFQGDSFRRDAESDASAAFRRTVTFKFSANTAQAFTHVFEAVAAAGASGRRGVIQFC